MLPPAPAAACAELPDGALEPAAEGCGGVLPLVLGRAAGLTAGAMLPLVAAEADWPALATGALLPPCA